MKKFIITASVLLSSVALSTYGTKQPQVKIANYKAVVTYAKNDVGTGD